MTSKFHFSTSNEWVLCLQAKKGEISWQIQVFSHVVFTSNLLKGLRLIKQLVSINLRFSQCTEAEQQGSCDLENNFKTNHLWDLSVQSWCSHVSFKSCFLCRSSSHCKLPLLLLPLFSPQWFRIRDGSVCPLHTNDHGVFPLSSSESSDFAVVSCAADDRNAHSVSVSVSVCQPFSVSFSWCWGAPGSFSSSVIAAEASECPRLDIKPSSRLGGDVHESIRRPGSWGNPERPRWRPEDRTHEHGPSCFLHILKDHSEGFPCFLTLLTCGLYSPATLTPSIMVHTAGQIRLIHKNNTNQRFYLLNLFLDFLLFIEFLVI